MAVMRRLLIANRGEIAIRIARAASELEIATVGIYSEDDARSLHLKAVDQTILLAGRGPAAYLNIAGVIAAAKARDCDAVHPGYGLLSENAEFARACASAGLTFVGPSPEMLALFGDKLSAKRAAQAARVPVLSGSSGDDRAAVAAYMAALPPGTPLIVKALAGGGGRGIRVVRDSSLLDEALGQCAREAQVAFGSGAVLIERFIARARHIEVQVAGDGVAVHSFGTRDCSVQRRNQKLIEIAPAPGLSADLSDRIEAAARAVIGASGYRGLATVEFLLDRDADPASDEAFAFIEVNPRLQVEHTITEEVTGCDLVKLALKLASGARLADLPLGYAPSGTAMQLRINAELTTAQGETLPARGSLTAYDPPSGPGVRVDGAGYTGYTPNPLFDSLLAKVIVRGDDLASALLRGRRAVEDFGLSGLTTNLDLMAAMLDRPELATTGVDTGWFDRTLPDLLSASRLHRHFERHIASDPVVEEAVPEGHVAIRAAMNAVLTTVSVGLGDPVRAGGQVGFVEALKMEHAITAGASGVVAAVRAAPGDFLCEGQIVLILEPSDVADAGDAGATNVDLDHIRAELAELHAVTGYTQDTARPKALQGRHDKGFRSARENLAHLFDGGDWFEYGALAVAAQRKRRSLEDLMRDTPADGLLTGTGTVNADHFGVEAAGCAALAYDYTVLAGTQGLFNHHKTDRLLERAEQSQLPVIFYTEGGGGRPGDVDSLSISGLTTRSFGAWAALSGKVPRIGITNGYCFAGNAMFFGASDITIATQRSFTGLGGPAMIEGGGLGRFAPTDIGPSAIQVASGVIDLLVADEAEATDQAKRLLGMFQGRLAIWDAADQRLLRHIIPENRVRTFDIRAAITGLVDTASFIELRRGFGHGMIIGFARVEGRAIGLMANDNAVMSGVIDSNGADKASRFMQLCDAFGVPILSLCDTPGFMVGPESEKTASVRHGSRMFITAQSLTVPLFTVVLRKGYGLGAQAMAGGALADGGFTISWPTGEFGGMGLEGAVRLGYRRELEAIDDLEAREARYQDLVAAMYAAGKAVSVARVLEVDAVIDPADTRRWIAHALATTPVRRGTRMVDSW